MTLPDDAEHERRPSLTPRVRRSLAGLAHAWRHSLQMRVGTRTVLITGTVVIILGLLLVDQVASGVLRAKRSAAIGQARIGLQVARSALSDVDAGDFGAVAGAQSQISSTLTASGTSAGLFTIV